MRKFLLLLALGALVSTGCFTATAQSPSTSQAKPGPTATPTETPAKKYATDEDGLKGLMTDLFAAKEKDDDAEFKRLCKLLSFKDAGKWFEKVYGADTGGKLTDAYTAAQPIFATAVWSTLDQKGATVAGIEIAEVRTEDALGLELLMLEKQVTPTRLYSVKLDRNQLRYFVVAEGQWRCIGKCWSAIR